jgi:predicted nucleic acid-binding protein
MIVVDASVLVEALLHTPSSEAVKARIFDVREVLHAPHVIDLEIGQVFRRFVAAGDMAPERGRLALADLAAMPMIRHAHGLLMSRVWELRGNLSAYDAAYVALAEALAAPLVTRDRRLAAAPGHRARIELL